MSLYLASLVNTKKAVTFLLQVMLNTLSRHCLYWNSNQCILSGAPHILIELKVRDVVLCNCWLFCWDSVIHFWLRICKSFRIDIWWICLCIRFDISCVCKLFGHYLCCPLASVWCSGSQAGRRLSVWSRLFSSRRCLRYYWLYLHQKQKRIICYNVYAVC